MQVGAVLDNRFGLLELVGRGGMGHVFKARDLTTAGFVAIKTLLPELASDPVAADELRRECFRLAVHAAESWLLADAANLAAFLGVSIARLPGDPDRLPDPKGTLVALACHSRKRIVREDMVPRRGSRTRVGPGYASRIMEFAGNDWQPKTAARNSASLAGCLAALRQWRRHP